MAEQRTLYDRGEYRLGHIETPPHPRKHGRAYAAQLRMKIRAQLRLTCIDDQYPTDDHLPLLGIGLSALAEVWDMKHESG